MSRLPNILVQMIPHESQRYDTAGDYLDIADMWHFRISKTGNWKYDALILMHEMYERILMYNDGVTVEEVDEFDMNGEGKDDPDPGSLPSAPYHNQHMKATYIEHRLAFELGVNWAEYDKVLDSLEYKKEKE